MTTQQEKIIKYELFLHYLQMYAEVTLDNKRVKKLIERACSWSYAHRQGNGELTNAEQRKLIKAAFDKLTDVD
jgi:hypothetical protein